MVAKFICGFLLLALSSSVMFLANADPSAKLNDRDYLELASRLTEEKAISREVEKARNGSDTDKALFIAKHPGSDAALEFEGKQVTKLFEEQKLDEAIGIIKGIAVRYPDQPHGRSLLIRNLARNIINNPRSSPEIKAEAFEALVPMLPHMGITMYETNNYISSLPLSPVERYGMARRAEESCGAFQFSRGYLWRFLEPLKDCMPADKFKIELKRYIERYGTEIPEGHDAMLLMLELEAKSGDSASETKRKAIIEDDRRMEEELKKAFHHAESLFSDGKGTEAVAALTAVSGKYPLHVSDRLWNRWHNDFLAPKGRIMGFAPEERYQIGKLLLENIGACGTASFQALNYLEAGAELHPEEYAKTLLASCDKHVFDLFETAWFAKWRLRRPPFSDSRNLMLEGLQAAVGILSKIGAHDLERQYLQEVGILFWDSDPELAKDALRKMLSMSKPEHIPALAGWMLANLEGRIAPDRDLLPTAPRYLDTAPVLPIKAGKVGHVETALFADGKDPLRPPSSKTGANVAAGITAEVSSGSNTALLATDGKADTAWKPENCPASFTIPLPRLTTVEKIRIRMLEPSSFTVLLLDQEGFPIRRYDRDNMFQDNAAHVQPVSDLTIFPLADVTSAFVRIDVNGTDNGKSGISELEIYPAAYPAIALLPLPPESIISGSRSVRIDAEKSEPEETILYPTDLEAWGIFPFNRWDGKHWLRERRGVHFSNGMNDASIFFYGTNPVLTVSYSGRLAWQIDGGADKDVINRDITDMTESAKPTEYKLKCPEEAGVRTARQHSLTLQRQWTVPPKQDKWTSWVQVNGLKTKGISRADLLIRFGNAKGGWTAWHGPAESGTAVGIPSNVEKQAVSSVQVASYFDNRETLSKFTAEIRNLRLSFLPEKAGELPVWNEKPCPPAPKEDLDGVAKALMEQRIPIAYSKVGTKAEYEAAKSLAEKAGVYFVTDDIGLAPGTYDGPCLAVGIPLRNRINRQLVNRMNLWSNPAYLNSPEGLVGSTKDINGKPDLYYVTGETPEAVLAALHRLDALVKLRSVIREKPFHVFTSSTLEVVYPWQIHPERPELDLLSLRMGMNDRRSLQFGISANCELKDLSIKCGDLVSEDGGRLSAPLIRRAGAYELDFFFGDIRIPNQLVPGTRTIPANCAQGIWLTFSTEGVKAGKYNSILTVSAKDASVQIPLTVKVEDIALPRMPACLTFSFSNIPWWIHPETEFYEKEHRALVENEISHGSNLIQIQGNVIVIDAPWERPASAKFAKTQSETNQQAPAESNKEKQALYLEFPKPVLPCVLTGWFGVQAPTEKSPAGETAPLTLRIEAKTPSGDWRQIGEKQVFSNSGIRSMFRFAGFSESAKEFRIRSESDEIFQQGEIRAYCDRSWKSLVSLDFSEWDRSIKIIDKVFQSHGLPPPELLTYCPQKPGFEEDMAEQIAEYLRSKALVRRVYLKVGDEPGDIAAWTTWARPYKNAGNRVMTCHNHVGKGDSKEAELMKGIANPWCPVYNSYYNDTWISQRESGDKMWWYCCGMPTTRLTGRPTENMPFYWLTAKWKMDGAMSFAAHFANKENIPFRYDNGMDHRIMLLPSGEILDTTRRELESDGIHDLKIVEFIRSHINASRKNESGINAAGLIEKELEEIIASVVPFKDRYAFEASEWEAARDKLYDLALRAQKAQ